jgi:hypothetical protein
MPQYLIDRLDRAGWIDAAMGATRQARATRCNGCHQAVIRGLTNFPGALAVDADPRPLTALGEALCLIQRRRTYELRHFPPADYDLDARDQWRRKERPAGATRNVDVLALHLCGNPPPGPYAATMLLERSHKDPGDEPPF